MPESLLAVEQRQRSASGNLTLRWAGYIGLTTAVGLAYFLVAELGLGLYGQTNFVSVFWPGFGLSAGVLIALGPRARWQDVDGFILTDGTEVKVPKHLSAQFVYAIHPGDAVTVRGLRAFALPLIDAATITNDATGATVVDNGPPGPDRWGSATTSAGKVSATLHGPRGEVNGALLENGMILRLGPREAASQSALLQPGQTIAARGVSTTTLLGTVMEVEAIGASPDQLVEVGPPPGRPGRGPGPRPDDRGPPPPPR